jgi:cyclopropane fatty-acyl-phospholipid synthase-like methyltransferase
MDVFDNAYKLRKQLFGCAVTEELAYVTDKFHVSGTALELGCGDGRDTFHMLQRGLSVEAIDKSQSAIDNLLSRQDIVPFASSLCAYANDIRIVHFKRDTYDFIYGVTFIDHLIPEDCTSVLKKIKPLFHKGSYWFHKVHTIDDDGFNAKENASEFSGQILHYYKHNELLRQFETFGRILFYQEASEVDNDHGPQHWHSFASIFVKT